MTERTKEYGQHVRVVSKAGPPPSCDLHVQIRDKTLPTGWRTMNVYNDMSNDYALTQADTMARHYHKVIYEGEYPNEQATDRI